VSGILINGKLRVKTINAFHGLSKGEPWPFGLLWRALRVAAFVAEGGQWAATVK
jgi:hypothetical protein